MWTDMKPAWKDLIIGFSITVGSEQAYICIDKLDSGEYRVTEGNLFGSSEVHRDKDLEQALRRLQKKVDEIELKRRG